MTTLIASVILLLCVGSGQVLSLGEGVGNVSTEKPFNPLGYISDTLQHNQVDRNIPESLPDRGDGTDNVFDQIPDDGSPIAGKII